MAAESILSSLSAKLSHPLVEIRIGALDSLLNRLDRCILGVHDLIQSKDILYQLLKWFESEPCPRKEDILKLILLILKADTSATLTIQIGLHNVFSHLEKIQKSLPTELLPLLFEIMDVIQLQEAARLELSDSARSVETKECVVHREIFPIFLLPWQHLIPTDRQVLLAVYDSLSNLKDSAQVTHSCQFFIDVMLRDFPPEIFLQRPSIVKTLLQLSEQDNSQISERAISCLNALTSALLARIRCFCESQMDDTKCQAPVTFSSDSEVAMWKRKDDRWNRSDDRDGPSSNVADSFHYDTSRTSDGEIHVVRETEMKQWSVPHFCTVTLLRIFPLVDFDSRPGVDDLVAKLVRLLTQCVSPDIWSTPATNPLATDMAVQIQEVLKLMGHTLLQHRSGERKRLLHVQLLAVVRELLQLVPLSTADRCVPRSLKDALAVTIMDPVLRLLYPRLHQDLLHFLEMFRSPHDVENLRIYRNTVAVTDSMVSAVNILKSDQSLPPSDFIKSAEQALLSLPFHRNLRFISLFINQCSENYVRWNLDEEESKIVSTILLKLLAHGDLELRTQTYQYLHTLTVASVGVNQTIRNTSHSLAFFVFDSAILSEIITYGVGNADIKLREYAEDTILHLLKAHLHLSASSWTRFLESLAPVLPLLQCWATQTSPLGRAITAMLDPDIGGQIKLPPFKLLTGNLRLLFSKFDHRRTEAVSRLIWLLGKEEETLNRLLDFSILQDSLPGTLCILDSVPMKFAPLPEQPYYQEGSVIGAVELIQCNDCELRQSALIQLNVMLEDPRLHGIFLDMDGLSAVLDILAFALRQERMDEFLSWINNAVNILRSLCLHHPKTRHSLSQDVAFLYDVLRVLFLSSCDARLRLAVVQLTASLLYDQVAHPLSPRSLMAPSFSLPHLIVEKMLLPFHCSSHGRTSQFTEPALSEELVALDLCRPFLRLYWSVGYCGGVESVLENGVTDVASARLQLEEGDAALLVTSSLVHVTHRQLSLVDSACSHQQVAACLDVLTAVVNLYQSLARWHQEKPVSWEVVSDIVSMEKRFLDLQWESALVRFLVTAPASADDQYLLIRVMEFLQKYVRVLQCLDLPASYRLWLCPLLQKMSQPLPSLLRNVAEAGDTPLPKWKEVSREVVALITECCRLERLRSGFENGPNEWCDIIENLAHCLRFSDTQHFYNLAYLDRHLSALTELTCSSGWHSESLLEELFPCLLELTHTFHLECGKNGTSFMGLSITRSSVLCLNHLLVESFSNISIQDWDTHCGTLLHSLWHSRDSLVRCAALQQVAGLVLSEDFFSVLGFDMCTAAMRILLDHEEASYVREQAAVLLSHVTSLNISSGQPGIAVHLGVLQELLSDGNFLSGLWTMFSRFTFVGKCRARGSCGETVGVTIFGKHGEEDVVVRSDSDSGRVVPVTPRLIKALCDLITNCLRLKWGNYLGGPGQQLAVCLFRHLSSVSANAMLLRCLGPIPHPIERDVIEMYCSVCHVLATCARTNDKCHAVLLQLPDLLHTLLPLLEEIGQVIAHDEEMLRMEVFSLLATLVEKSNDSDAYSPIHGALVPLEAEPLASSLLVALGGESKYTGRGSLKHASICCAIGLLSHPASRLGTPFQFIVDQCRTTAQANPKETSFGAELCTTLLDLYELYCYSTDSLSKMDKPSADEISRLVTKALSSLLLVSFEAKKQAAAHGLAKLLHMQLGRELCVLALEPVDCLNRVSDKRRVCPPLRKAEQIVDLANNFAFGDETTKSNLAISGLPDDVHKLWMWSLYVPSLLKSSLRFLVTLTSHCQTAAHSLVLTTTTPGLGLRRTPSSHSLLHALVTLVHQEMTQIGRGHSFDVLQLSFGVLTNSCHVPECRVVLTKSTLLRDLRLLNRKHKELRPVISLWMQFLIQLTAFAEGQVAVPKSSDFVDFLVNTASNNTKLSSQAMQVLRNVSFHNSNRGRLFGSGAFLNLLYAKLVSENAEDQVCALASLWALIANNQKGKLAVKCAKLDSRVKEAVRLARQDPGCNDYLLQLLNCVARVLSSDPAVMLVV